MRIGMRWAVAAIGCATFVGGVAPAAAAPRAAKLSRTALTENAGWKKYVLDSPTPFVYPKAITVEGDAGAVTDVDALKAADGKAATIRATGKGAPTLIIDLGINTGGRVEVGLTKTDGTTVHLAYAEARRYLNQDGDMVPPTSLGKNDDPNGRTDDVTAAGAFTSPGVRGAERWIQLQLQGAGEVSIDYVRVHVTHVRPKVSDYVGRFLSSDDLLNRIWYGSAYTWNVAAFKDPNRGGNTIVTDAGKRDRWAWLGDLAIENLMSQYGIRQAPRIVRDSIELFSCQQYPDGYIPEDSDIHPVCKEPGPADGPPANAPDTDGDHIRLPEYTAWWVIALQRYAFDNGDDAVLKKMLRVVRRAIDYYRANLSNGVFVSQGSGLVINWHPFDLAPGVDAHTQAVWYRALNAAAAAERRVGDPAKAKALRGEAADLKKNALEQLWDDKTGALVVNTNDRTNHTYDAQAEGVLSGLLTGDKATRALTFVNTHLRSKLGYANGESTSDPYMSQYNSPYISSDDLLGRFGHGDTAGALDLIRRLYGYMVTHDPASTMWEKVRDDGSLATYAPNGAGDGVVPDNTLFAGGGTTSMAHPWSGGAMTALSEYVAGLQATATGWKRWRVAPHTGDIAWAQGQVKTPAGVLVSRWQRGAKDRSFRLTVRAPRRTRGVVAIPMLGGDHAIARNGKVVWRNGKATRGITARRSGDTVRIAQGPGQFTYAWTR